MGASSCIIPDPDHCSTEGAAPCPGAMVCDPCTPSNLVSNGCVDASEVMDTDPDVAGCQGGGPVGTAATSNDDTSSGEESTTTSSDVDTTATDDGTDTTTTGPMPCMGNGDCDAGGAAPFCSPDSGMCVPCSMMPQPDDACAAVDGMRPLCRDDVCVQCTPDEADACMDGTPICDGELGSCVPCTAHDQCPGGAGCNLFDGECLPSDAVVMAGPTGDYTSLALAVAGLGAGDGTIIVQQASFDEPVVVSGTRVIAFVAADGTMPSWTRTRGAGGPSQLRVDGATVLMEGIQVSANNGSVNPGIRVETAGRLWIDRGRIIGNPGGAVIAQENSELVLRNSFMGGNQEIDVLQVLNSSASILYTTIGGGLTGTPGSSTGLYCEGTGSAEVRNSIIVSRDTAPEIECMDLMVSDSAMETDPGVGAGNTIVGDVVLTWFVDYNAGDFHLMGDGLGTFTGVATWTVGDPPVDIDEDARPMMEAPDYAGADVP